MHQKLKFKRKKKERKEYLIYKRLNWNRNYLIIFFILIPLSYKKLISQLLIISLSVRKKSFFFRLTLFRCWEIHRNNNKKKSRGFLLKCFLVIFSPVFCIDRILRKGKPVDMNGRTKDFYFYI